MAFSLRNHPFGVSAHFNSTTILTFSVDKEELAPLVPEPLILDLYQDKWAFLTVAMVDTKHLRPTGLPKILGRSFFLIGYRIFVRYKTSSGRTLRGLYILKSETNKKIMEVLGDVFSRYNYKTIDITQNQEDNLVSIYSNKSNFKVSYSKCKEESAALPEGSIFLNWKDARKFVGPMPFTFEVDAKKRTVLILEGKRNTWIANPIHVESEHFAFLNKLHLNSLQLANAFEICDVSYSWKKGVLDSW